MKSKWLIFAAFLLIPCISSSQDGSTRYPLTETQLRKAARVQIEYTYLLEENRSMYDMLRWCDSIQLSDSLIKDNLNSQLSLKDKQIYNRNLSIAQWETKCEISKEQIRRERKRKNLYFVTTSAALTLLVVSFFK